MAAMEVPIEIKSTEIVKPAEKTWLGTMELSELDIVNPKMLMPMLYVYKPNKEWIASSISQTLKESLGKVLVHFYPFTGRLRSMGVGKMVLDVDDTSETWGVPVVEAETTMELVDLGDDLLEADQKGSLRNLFSMVDIEKPIEELSLLNVKITHFRCGGVAVAITWSHVIGDGFAAGHFFSEWTRIARGEPLGIAPVHDRTLLRPRKLSSPVPEYIHPVAPINVNGLPPLQQSTVMLPLSKSQVEKLKKIAGPVINARPYSRYEVLAAHAWRCMSKGKTQEDKKVSSFSIIVEIRKRINPPLPEVYHGNAAIAIMATSKGEELVSKPLAYACDIIRKTIDKVTNDVTWTIIHNQKSLNDVVESTMVMMTPEGHFVCPQGGFISWLNLSINNLDFGWGQEAHMACDRKWFDGFGFLQVGKEEGSVIVVMCLQTAHVNKFKEYFYDQFE